MERLAVRIGLTLLALLSLPSLLLSTTGSTLPMTVQRDAVHGYIVAAVPEIALPPELRVGDVLDLPAMSFEARAALIGANNVPAGFSTEIVIRRDAAAQTVTLSAVPARTRLNDIQAAASYPFFFSVLALLLLTLWRGRDWSAWALSLFAFGVLLQNLLQNLPLPVIWNFAGVVAGRAITNLLTLPALYFAAEALVGTGLDRRIRRLTRGLLLILTLFTLALVLSRLLLAVIAGSTALIPYAEWARGPLLVIAALPVVVMTLGYRGSAPERRLRIRWVLWSTGLLFATIVLQTRGASTKIWMILLDSVLLNLSIAGYLYAVLRHRLVDVSFVIDRTLVYGMTTGLVVGVFAVLEQLVEQLALGNNASLLLQAGLTLVVALLLNRVHRRAEDLVDRLLFREQHRSTALLREFTRQCSAVENVDRLLPLAISRIIAAIGEAGVAIYEREASAYVLKGAGGRAGFPATVEVDDAVFLALRGGQPAVEIAAETIAEVSALGRDGWAFPISRQGQLTGALVCLPPTGVQFAPDQRAALAQLAQELGVAQYLLRARLYADFVTAVAAGEVAAPQDQARRLLDRRPVGA